MKKSIIFKYLMALVVIAMSAMVVASCGDDDDDNGGSNGSGIYGTWVSTLEDGEVVTVVIAQNSMKIQWAYDDESETEIYDSFSYDESTKKITAHHCKTIYVYDGKTTEEEDDGIVVYGKPTDLYKIKEAITSVKPVTFDIDEIGMFPKETVTLTGEDKEIFSKFLNMVDEMEDVKTVYHNVNL